jgi:hypothetical protein
MAVVDPDVKLVCIAHQSIALQLPRLLQTCGRRFQIFFIT